MATWSAHILLGPLMLALAVLFRIFPSKRINYLYGYRMPGAMVNQDTWAEANRYAANMLIVHSAALSVIQVFLMWLLPPTSSISAAAALLVIAVISIIPLTEVHLRKTFDPQGRRKSGHRH